MSSLSVHLGQTEDHSALPFHPSCPVCRRERLAGSLDGEELVSRRTQAAIAAGLLAFSAVGPTAAVAAGPDEEIEGSAEIVETGDTDSLELGDSTIALDDAGPAAPDDETAAPVSDGSDVAFDEASNEEAPDDGSVEAEAEAPEPAVEPAPAPEPVAVAAPPAATPPTTGAPEQVTANQLRVDRAAVTKRTRRAVRSVEHRVVASPAPAVAPSTTAQAPVTVRVVAGTSADQAAPGDRFHTVRRVESLWSIASDMLGENASVDRVAREVSRLWELNAERIGTGSPDLVFAGTRLMLR
jgi:hypothetical protein